MIKIFFLNSFKLFLKIKDELIDVVSDHEAKLKEMRLDYEKQLNALRSEIGRLKDEVILNRKINLETKKLIVTTYSIAHGQLLIDHGQLPESAWFCAPANWPWSINRKSY